MENFNQMTTIDKIVMNLSESIAVKMFLYAGIIIYSFATFNLWHTEEQYKEMMLTHANKKMEKIAENAKI